MKDKIWCSYSVVDLATNMTLALGTKLKSVENIGRDYRYSGISFRSFPKLWQRVFVYYRLVEICGVRCVIILREYYHARLRGPFNGVLPYGTQYGMSGKYYYGSLLE